MSQTFLITGATGQQGGHTTRLLLAAGHKVHALARNPSSEAAIELKSLGASIFPGGFSDSEAIFAAAQGCTGIFINVSPVFSDPEGEQKHAWNIIAASACGVVAAIRSALSRHGRTFWLNVGIILILSYESRTSQQSCNQGLCLAQFLRDRGPSILCRETVYGSPE